VQRIRGEVFQIGGIRGPSDEAAAAASIPPALAITVKMKMSAF
jgi:hypothetical protein